MGDERPMMNDSMVVLSLCCWESDAPVFLDRGARALPRGRGTQTTNFEVKYEKGLNKIRLN